MPDNKIVLNKEAFKALASETRIDVLKLLDSRRMTQTEIAGALHMTVQSVSDHVNKLEHAGLIQRQDEGRKWVYYGLSESGMAILHPERKAFWVMLGVSALMLSFGFFNVLTAKAQQSALAAQALGAEAANSMMKSQIADGAAQTAPMAQEAIPAIQGLMLTPLDFALILIGALLFGASVTYLFARKKSFAVALILLVCAMGAFAFVFQ